MHNLLVREETRTQVALIIESGEPREVMHFALLIGYGASAVNPYLAIETLEDLRWRGYLPSGVNPEKRMKNFIKAINKGLLKTFSKMGISTLQSYRGAQVFEAIGLNQDLVDTYFTGTTSRIEGVTLGVLAREAQIQHEHAFQPMTDSETDLAVGGTYHYPQGRRVSPAESGHDQQAATCGAASSIPKTFKEYTDLIDNQNRNLCYAARVDEVQEVRQAGADRRGRASEGDREALHHGRDVVRVDQQRSARDARDCDEPHRRQIEHRRRRRGRGALQARCQRRSTAQCGEAGGVGTLRRDDELSGQCGRAADQDGARREARRRRPAAWPQSGRRDRAVAAFDPRAWA